MEKDTVENLLSTNVLVLNKLYMVLRVITVRRAFVFLAKDYAEVIYKNNGRFENCRFGSWIEVSNKHNIDDLDDYIHTPKWRILVPRVIRLLEYDKMPRREWKLNRKNILIRDNYQCQYCDKKYPLGLITIDHIIPRSRGGTTAWTNVVTCCNKCNTKKGGRLPREAGMKLITKPQKPNFNYSISKLLDDKKYSIWKEFIKDLSTPPSENPVSGKMSSSKSLPAAGRRHINRTQTRLNP
ncbi:MAG: HNH endonuclease [Planctomycetota bacterium]